MQFGLICAGRPVQADFAPVDPTLTKFATMVAGSERVNHLVVFVSDPFPAGFAATVHIQLPGRDWQMLGALSNDKPSAIFRLSGLRGLDGSAAGSTEDMDMTDAATALALPPANLGISVEPIDLVMQQLAALPSSRQSAMSMSGGSGGSASSALSQSTHILQNLYNYVTSFATTALPPMAHTVGGVPAAAVNAFGFGGGAAPTTQVRDDSWIPVKAFEAWYSRAVQRVKNDPNYFDKAMD
ncbi:hypothetical protein H9P43_001444 [Blastocladiella emersonii ATCC 22665]|nr:hypothetical protein H9P43_001444 [Blastocladiella emersonii ATCC 22665]